MEKENENSFPAEMPEDVLNMTKLAKLYDKNRRTLQKYFRKNKIYDAIGQKKGYDLSPKQLLIIFILYEAPPGKYYRAYLLMERKGIIIELIKLWQLEKYKPLPLQLPAA